jgi:DNA-binding response OmpR family regulator
MCRRPRAEPPGRRVRAGDAEVPLRPKEFGRPVPRVGEVVTRERFMDEVWDENRFGPTKTLDVHVSTLRRKLGTFRAHHDPARARLSLRTRGRRGK